MTAAIKKMKTNMINSRMGDLVPKKSKKEKKDDVESKPRPASTYDLDSLKAFLGQIEREVYNHKKCIDDSVKRAKQRITALEKEQRKMQKSASRPTKANQEATSDKKKLDYWMRIALGDINALAEESAKKAEELEPINSNDEPTAHIERQEGYTDGLVAAAAVLKKLLEKPESEVLGSWSKR